MGHRLRVWRGSLISMGHQVDVLLLSLDGSFSFSFSNFGGDEVWVCDLVVILEGCFSFSFSFSSCWW